MALVDTNLILGDLRVTRWGLVTVMLEDRTIDREHQITPAEADAVHAGRALPPGVTLDEWQSGRVMVSSRPCLAGECVRNPDGTLIINTRILAVAGKIQATLTKCQPSEWEFVGGKVRIEESIKLGLGL